MSPGMYQNQQSPFFLRETTFYSFHKTRLNPDEGIQTLKSSAHLLFNLSPFALHFSFFTPSNYIFSYYYHDDADDGDSSLYQHFPSNFSIFFARHISDDSK
jgi:hypothetical protein